MSVLRRSRRVVTLDMVANNPAIVESLDMKDVRRLNAQLEMAKEGAPGGASPREDEQDAAAGLASTAAAMIH